MDVDHSQDRSFFRKMENEPTGLDTVISRYARELARKVLAQAEARGLCIATAESCTGGLLSTILTGLPGVSHCFECGFVVYSNAAKTRMLGISKNLLDRHGAVSRVVAIEMAERALRKCEANVALAITGFAGPGGKNDEEGLVHFAVATSMSSVQHREKHYGTVGRDGVRTRALEFGLEMLMRATGE